MSRMKNSSNMEEAQKRIYFVKEYKTNELDLSNLNLTKIPDEVFELTQLESLNLGGWEHSENNNKIKKLPKEISRLHNLSILDLNHIQLNELPKEIGHLENLYDLNINRNCLTELPKEVVQLKKLKSLGLSRNKLSLLPIEIYQLQKLERLDLSYNQLTKVSTEIVQLGNLKELDLSGNLLTDLVVEIFQLKNLKKVYLGLNHLKELPKEIIQLSNLEILDIRNNKLKKVPRGIFGLNNLGVLYLSNNQITELPKEIYLLKKLQYLNLENNKLAKLPEEISQLKNVRRINLKFNQINKLPRNIYKLHKLEELELFGNGPLISPPQSVIKDGTKAILNYLEAMHERTEVWASKMVIVGEGGVGKTCLLDAIEGKPFIFNNETTHGIGIRKLSFQYETEKKSIRMELMVWDFGGQDIYHATHQFYLTNHSLFILVWSARLGYEAGKLYKWLETINALAPDSPILIVATHSKERGADLPKGDILSMYPNKIQFFEVDNKNKQGVGPLKDAVRDTAYNLKHMGVERPKSWVNATIAVQKLNKKCLTRQELFDIFHQYGVDEENYESMAIYLHELGYILNYPDEEELKDTIIIKPAWVSQHIARILDSEEVTKREGFFPKKLMKSLWHDLEPHWHDKFITLMEKFDLSYKTEDFAEMNLIVERLKYEEHPKYEEEWQKFDGQKEIIFKYKLDTIPAGIPTWFIARTHRFTRYIHWRHGALLQDKEKNHLGLVIARYGQKEVWLHVRGVMPYYFFAQLRDTLELTFNRFEGLGRTVYVPCPGHNGKFCPHLFNLKHLEKRLETTPPKYYIECPESENLEEVDVMQMLFGLSFAPENMRLVEQISREVRRTIDEQTHTIVHEMQTQNQELVKFIQLEFLKSYHFQQEIMDQTCPNLFTLKPKDKNFFNKPIAADEFELQLYCQKPGCIHPVEDGLYTIKVPKKWLISIAPYYNKMLKTLKWIVPILIPGTKALLGDTVAKAAEPALGILKDYIKKLPQINVKEEDLELLDDIKFEHASGAELRYIRQLLDEMDKNHYWGGLRRKPTPEGHILWLCPEHIKEYR